MSAEGNRVIRKRLVEYLGGGDDLDSATADFLSKGSLAGFSKPKPFPVGDLDRLLQEGTDIARSLSDRGSLLVHIDIEYVDFDHPEAAHVDPWRAFRFQEPVIAAFEEVLLDWGIAPLHLITGQGHHLAWRVRLDCPVCRRLAELAVLPGGVISPAGESLAPGIPPVSDEVARAFGGLGLLIEFVAHSVRCRAAPNSEIPVQITAVHVGLSGPDRKREIVSIDTSEYGDPLQSRVIRMPFTPYRKPWASGLVRALGIGGELPTAVFSIPLHEMDVGRAIQLRQVASEVEELAHRASAEIPEQEHGMKNLTDAYLASPLRKFHEHYYDRDQGSMTDWAKFDWGAVAESLPPCGAHILREPNDLLLKPAGIEMVTRCLMAEGWHPRRIAGGIRSIFQNPRYLWDTIWTLYDPGMRADFYVRLFSGLIATGVDGLVDFNCTSMQEKGFCPESEVGCSLDPSRRRLLSMSFVGG